MGRENASRIALEKWALAQLQMARIAILLTDPELAQKIGESEKRIAETIAEIVEKRRAEMDKHNEFCELVAEMVGHAAQFGMGSVRSMAQIMKEEISKSVKAQSKRAIAEGRRSIGQGS